jgi:S1-C subfamily serine protease
MIKKILLALIFASTAMADDNITISNSNLKTEAVEVSSRMSSVEKKVRSAAVRVVSGSGHGSGGIIKYKDIQLVLTAQHVADGRLGQTYLLRTESEQRLGVLIYADPLHDTAIIFVIKKFDDARGIKFNPAAKLPEPGDEITYSGYPSWHSLMTYRGRVAGFETHPQAGTQIMLYTYGWFGCSGSLVYNIDGAPIGILWGIDVQQGGPQENMIWVSPIQNLDMKLALKALCTSVNNDLKACK